MLLKKIICVFLMTMAIPGLLTARERASLMDVEDELGITVMGRYTYRDWSDASSSKMGTMEFDSFRIRASTSVSEHFSATAQYRFYDGWNTPHHYWGTLHLNDGGEVNFGQVWVPFGIDWQTFDDWGNINYYIGLQDDYDMGVTWSNTYGHLQLDAGFLKNQQLGSSSRERYDADIYSGSVGDYDSVATAQRSNEETNQVNLRAEYTSDMAAIGLSLMAGQLYNIDTDEMGSRLAGAAHAMFSIDRFHANIQAVFHDYDQELPETATRDELDFINVSCFNYVYEIPKKAQTYSASLGYDLLPDGKLMAHVNYSILTGGSSEADSHLWTFGFNSLGLFKEKVDLFLEAYYGKNDPNLSGDASGYGRDAGSSDFRVDLRFYYHFDILGMVLRR